MCLETYMKVFNLKKYGLYPSYLAYRFIARISRFDGSIQLYRMVNDGMDCFLMNSLNFGFPDIGHWKDMWDEVEENICCNDNISAVVLSWL